MDKNLINENNENNNDEIELSYILNTLIREKFLIIALTSISTFSIILSSYFIKPIFRGFFEIHISKEIDDINNKTISNIFPSVLSNSSTNLNQEYILKSPSVLMPIYKKAKNSSKKIGINIDDLDYNSWVKNYLDINFEDDTNILRVKYKGNNKNEILKNLNLISKQYQKYSNTEKQKKLKIQIDYLAKQAEYFQLKSEQSQKNLNKFAIDNGLGNFDGIVSLDQPKVNIGQQISSRNPSNIKKNLEDQINMSSMTSSSEINIRKPNYEQRFMRQFQLLERYEAQYLEYSSKLKPNSKLLKDLKKRINTIKTSLKRPNKILIQYNQLSNLAKRDNNFLNQIEDQLLSAKIEQARQSNPWQLITEPTLETNRIWPNRRQIGISTIIFSLIIGSIIAILKEKSSGIIFERDQLKRNINLKYLNEIYQIDPKINLKTIESFLKSLKIDRNVKKISIIYTGNNFYKSDYIPIVSFIEKNNHYEQLLWSEDSKIEKSDYLVVVFPENEITYKDLIKFKSYLNIYSEKILGWYYLKNQI